MSQHDYDITAADANTGAAVRAAINAALQALASNNSGATEPASPYAYMWWPDTGNDLLKQRNAANNAWINVLVLSTGQPCYAASATVAGVVELATAAETTAGTDTMRAITPDGFAGSDFGKRIVQLKICDDTTVVTTGDGKLIFCIPPELNGYNLVQAEAFVTTVSSSGTPTVQIRNVTDAHDMLTTRITIDANEYTSYTGAARSAVNTTYDDVATGDRIAIDVDVSGTGAKGLGVILSFQLP
jgi:hypothetical protein